VSATEVRPLEAPETPLAVQPPPIGFREYIHRCRVAVLAVAGAVFAMFLPALIVPYGFSDDYSILWMAVSGQPSPQFGKNLLDATATTGRPFSGLLMKLFFSAAGTIDNLRFVRLISVLGIVVLAILLHWSLVRARVSSKWAALVAILVCSMPAFQSAAAWTVVFVSPVAAVLAAAASILVVSAVDGPRHTRFDRSVGAGAAMLASLLLYQPPAMFFWVFLAVVLVGARYEPKRAVRLVKLHALVFGVAFAVWYAALRVGIQLVGSAAPGAQRSALNHHPIARLRWFFDQVLYQSFSLFRLTPTTWIVVLSSLVAAGGILLWLWRRATRPWLYAVVGAALIPLSYAPNLAVQDTYAPFRTQISLTSLIVLYVCLGAIGLYVSTEEWLAPRVRRWGGAAAAQVAFGAAGVFVASCVFFAARNVTLLIAIPQNTELRMLRSQVSQVPLGAARVAFVETDRYGGMAPTVVYDEFGLPTSSRPWALGPAVDLVLREEGRIGPDLQGPAVDIYSPATTSFPAGEPVVDLRGLGRLR
jgi:hypothetical protein